MKLKFKKVLSCFLAMILLLPFLNENLLDKQLLTYAILTQEDEEYFIDAKTELEYALLSKAGDWYTAVNIDGCAYNFFHNEILDYLTQTLHKGVLFKELYINYRKPVINPVTKKFTKYGHADLYMRDLLDEDDDSITYIWEVKPASYLMWDRRKLGVEQLKGISKNPFD